MCSTGYVSGNPRDSKHYSLARKYRRRRGIQLTLSPEAMKKLAALARQKKTSRSKVVEWLLLREE